MTNDEFGAVVKRRIDQTVNTLIRKGQEYTRGDRLSNFKNGAMLQRCTPERACLGYLTKQLVSVVDFVHDLDQGTEHGEAEWDEKIGDCVNYLILLEAVVKERRDAKNQT